jgi:diguanylate cyclase (GGDEF)-like protein
VDVNDLKSINDTYGHLEGDRAIVDTARILTGTFRASDVVGRLGGDEFVALVVGDPESDLVDETVDTVVGRLRRNLIRYNALSHNPWQLSLSIGLERCSPPQWCSVDELMERADQSMYAEKRRHKQLASARAR